MSYNNPIESVLLSPDEESLLRAGEAPGPVLFRRVNGSGQNLHPVGSSDSWTTTFGGGGGGPNLEPPPPPSAFQGFLCLIRGVESPRIPDGCGCC